MINCRNPGKGFWTYYCSKCDDYFVIHHSCNTSLCTQCGKRFTDAWAKRLVNRMFPFPHLRIVFTLPAQLRPYLQNNKKLIAVVSQCILSTTCDTFNYKKPKDQQVTPGIISVLHTFGKDLKFHPHFDCMVTMGGVTAAGKWLNSKPFSPKSIRRVWQYRVLNSLKGNIPNELIDYLFKKYPNGFVVDDKILPKNRKKKVDYIARYIRHPPIAESRIDYFDSENVLFHYEDKQKNRHEVEMSVFDFFSALLLHLKEKGKHIIKYSGIYHNKCRSYYFQVLKISQGRQKKLHIAGVRCPKCGTIMQLIDIFPPREQAQENKQYHHQQVH